MISESFLWKIFTITYADWLKDGNQGFSTKKKNNLLPREHLIEVLYLLAVPDGLDNWEEHLVAFLFSGADNALVIGLVIAELQMIADDDHETTRIAPKINNIYHFNIIKLRAVPE
jgi:hypothetical protein